MNLYYCVEDTDPKMYGHDSEWIVYSSSGHQMCVCAREIDADEIVEALNANHS